MGESLPGSRVPVSSAASVLRRKIQIAQAWALRQSSALLTLCFQLRALGSRQRASGMVDACIDGPLASCSHGARHGRSGWLQLESHSSSGARYITLAMLASHHRLYGWPRQSVSGYRQGRPGVLQPPLAARAHFTAASPDSSSANVSSSLVPSPTVVPTPGPVPQPTLLLGDRERACGPGRGHRLGPSSDRLASWLPPLCPALASLTASLQPPPTRASPTPSQPRTPLRCAAVSPSLSLFCHPPLFPASSTEDCPGTRPTF